MNNKIGLLTFHFSENYGALFQAYSIRRFLLKKGFEANFINYHPRHIEEGGSFDFRRLVSFKNLKVLFLKYSRIKRKFLFNKEVEQGFREFGAEHLGVTGSRILEGEPLKVSNYSAVVFGSDQIWNPSAQFGLDPVYFGGFDESFSGKRISYAASFGRSVIDIEHQQLLPSLLENLDTISVREPSGAKIISECFEANVDVVPDPTVLLEKSDFLEIMKPYDEVGAGKFGFVYALRSSSGIHEAAHSSPLAEGREFLSPYNIHRRWAEVGRTVYPCPRQWLWLMNQSDVVLTNSFHGVMMSVLLEKDFYAFGLPGGKASLNTRVIELLASVGLSRRFIAPGMEFKIDKQEIDWQAVRSKLAGMREHGSNFLLRALS